jgi:predicted MPP superfamily phosphohydrolase
VLAAMFRLILLGIHTYVWWRLIYQARLPRRWYIALTALIVVLFLSGPVTTASRNVWPSLSATFGWISLPWMALCGLTFIALVIIDVSKLFTRIGRRVVGRRAQPTSPDRRVFLSRITGGAAMAIGSASVARGMVSARGEHQIVDVEIKLAKLPAALDGFSIVQLSDLHVGMTIDRDFVQRVVDGANALSPDLIVLTGDLVDGRVEDLRDEAAPLANLKAKHGLYAVTGNHEYYSDADPWIRELTSRGIRYLRNEHVEIAGGFTLAGVDDHSARGYEGHGADYKAALDGRDPAKPVVLLAHQPRQVRRAAEHGVDFQLSGHTHGGQIWPWHYLVKLQQGGFLGGYYEWKGTQLYVTRGCGYWGPPVRLLAPLEITRVILRAA